MRGKIKQAKALFSAFLTDGAYIVFSRRRAKAEADKVDQWTKFSVTDIGQTFGVGTAVISHPSARTETKTPVGYRLQETRKTK